MRITFDLDDQLHKQLSDEALARQVSFDTVIHEAIARGLDKVAQHSEPNYRVPSMSLGIVPDEFNLVKALQLAADLEDEEIVRELARGR